MVGSTPEQVDRFFAAIERGDAGSVLSQLLEEPTLIETCNEDGLSPLMFAAYHRVVPVFEVLLGQGARPGFFEAAALGAVDDLRAALDVRPTVVKEYTADGWTALHLAAHFGRAEAIRFLLVRGADVSAIAQNDVANQPLESAAAGGHLESVRLLLEAGAPVDAPSKGGFTALHVASEHGDPTMVELLLAAGADPGRRTDEGRSAFDLAQARSHQDIVELIQERARTRT